MNDNEVGTVAGSQTAEKRDEATTSISVHGALGSGANRVLVIDDDPAVGDAFELALDETGMDICVANEGAVGLELLRKEPFGCVFLDLRMPELSGIETLWRLRSEHPTLPVCVLTGFAEDFLPSLIDAANASLDFELCRKPLDIEEIRSISAKLLGRS